MASFFTGFFQARMPEIELGAHTIRSHGSTVARGHMHDWIILVLLGIIEIVLYVIHPFYRYVSEEMMTDLKYPLKENTVPVWSVPIYAVLLPIAIFVFFYFRRRDVYDLHHGVLGLLFAILITGVITDAIKVGVGRPRPNFYWRCFPDGVPKFYPSGDVNCHGEASVIKEGYKSFPSGHTSWSFAGLGFLSLYLAGKIKAFDREGHVAKLCLVFLPLLAACMVGISRVDDYWHHWQDVFAGGILGFVVDDRITDRILRKMCGEFFVDDVVAMAHYIVFSTGLVVATFCYLQFFAPPYHTEGWGPYAYFRTLEDSRADGNTNHQLYNGQNIEVLAMNQQTRSASNSFSRLPVHHDSGSSLDEMELGQR